MTGSLLDIYTIIQTCTIHTLINLVVSRLARGRLTLWCSYSICYTTLHNLIFASPLFTTGLSPAASRPILPCRRTDVSRPLLQILFCLSRTRTDTLSLTVVDEQFRTRCVRFYPALQAHWCLVPYSFLRRAVSRPLRQILFWLQEHWYQIVHHSFIRAASHPLRQIQSYLAGALMFRPLQLCTSCLAPSASDPVLLWRRAAFNDWVVAPQRHISSCLEGAIILCSFTALDEVSRVRRFRFYPA